MRFYIAWYAEWYLSKWLLHRENVQPRKSSMLYQGRRNFPQDWLQHTA
jgi:hypothetical protein